MKWDKYSDGYGILDCGNPWGALLPRSTSSANLSLPLQETLLEINVFYNNFDKIFVHLVTSSNNRCLSRRNISVSVNNQTESLYAVLRSNCECDKPVLQPPLLGHISNPSFSIFANDKMISFQRKK